MAGRDGDLELVDVLALASLCSAAGHGGVLLELVEAVVVVVVVVQ